MDIYREHIADEMSKATGIDAEKIYTRLAWTNTLDKGDLSLPVCELYITCVMQGNATSLLACGIELEF